MTEGVFPKIDGDIFYSSEANNFNMPFLQSGDEVLINNATARTLINPASYTVNKQTYITNIPGSHSIIAKVQSRCFTGGRTGAAILYINGVDAGLGSFVFADSYIAGSWIISNTINRGDRIEVYTKYTGAADNTASQDFKITGSFTPNINFAGWYSPTTL